MPVGSAGGQRAPPANWEHLQNSQRKGLGKTKKKTKTLRVFASSFVRRCLRSLQEFHFCETGREGQRESMQPLVAGFSVSWSSQSVRGTAIALHTPYRPGGQAVEWRCSPSFISAENKQRQPGRGWVTTSLTDRQLLLLAMSVQVTCMRPPCDPAGIMQSTKQ